MLDKIRGYIVAVCFVLFGLGTLVMAYVCFPLIKIFNKDIYKRLSTYSLFVQYSWRFFIYFLIFIGLIDLKIKNLEELTKIKKSIIVSTHPSFIDGILLIAFIPRTTCLVAERLSENFILKNIVKSMFILANDDLEYILKQTNAMLENDFNIIIFPAGKRHTKDEFPKIRRGAAMMALATGRDIVPIYLMTDIPFLQIGEPVHKALEKRVEYELEAMPKIYLQDYLSKTDDEVILKRDITKAIRTALYKQI